MIDLSAGRAISKKWQILRVKVWGCAGLLFKNWMIKFVSLLEYKRQVTGNKLCKLAKRSTSVWTTDCFELREQRIPGNVSLTLTNDRLLMCKRRFFSGHDYVTSNQISFLM